MPDYALNQVTNDLNYSDVKYQLGTYWQNENEKLLKAVDKLEQQRILETRYCTYRRFGLKININELHDLNEQLFTTIYNIIQTSDVYDDDIHKYHYVYDFETCGFLKIYVQS